MGPTVFTQYKHTQTAFEAKSQHLTIIVSFQNQCAGAQRLYKSVSLFYFIEYTYKRISVVFIFISL